MAHAFRCRPGGLRSLAAAVRRYPHHFTAPTERAPSREPASNGPSVSVQAWRAAVPRSRGSPISTPPHGADGAGALQRIGQQWPIGFGAGLEGCGPSQPVFRNRLPFRGDAFNGILADERTSASRTLMLFNAYFRRKRNRPLIEHGLSESVNHVHILVCRLEQFFTSVAIRIGHDNQSISFLTPQLSRR
jgi:hypothetical protein